MKFTLVNKVETICLKMKMKFISENKVETKGMIPGTTRTYFTSTWSTKQLRHLTCEENKIIRIFKYFDALSYNEYHWLLSKRTPGWFPAPTR